MGKNVWTKHSCSPVQNHPGFIWGLFNILKHNHWRYIKKRLPHKRVVGRRHAVGTRNEGNNMKSSNDGVLPSYCKAEADSYIDFEQRSKKPNSADKLKKPNSGEKCKKNNSVEKSKKHISEERSKKLQSEEKSKKPNSETKNSVKALIKAIISEDKSKRKSCHHRSSTYPIQSNSTENETLHQLEASGESSSNDGCTRAFNQTGDVSPAIGSLNPLFLMSEESSSSDSDENNPVDTDGKKLHGNEKAPEKKEITDKKAWFDPQSIAEDDDTSPRRSKAFMDALNLIHMNRDFFLKVLQDPGSPLAHHFQSQQALSAKLILTKASSFHVPGSSGMGDSQPNMFKHSKDHNASFAKKNGDDKDSSVGLDSVGDVERHLTAPSIAAEYRADGIQKLNEAMARVTDEDSSDSGYNRRKRGKNQVVVKRFKDLRQKIRHAIKENKDERHRISMDAVLDRVPREYGFSKDLRQDILEQSKEHSVNRSRKEGSKLKQIRRTSSLGGSLDRYLLLYESSFHKEMKNHTLGKSQSEAEETALPSRRAPKTLGRILSLPEMKSYSCKTEGSPDTFYPEKQPGQYTASSISDEQERDSLDVPRVCRDHVQSDTCIEREIPENTVDATEQPSSAFRNQLELASASTSEAKAEREIYEALTHDTALYLDQATEPARKSSDDSSEDSPCLESTFSFDEKASEFLISRAVESEPQRDLGTEVDATTTINDVRVEAQDKAKFNYVKDILEISGFSSTESLATWHSDYQPLDPSVFEEVTSIGGCILHDPECSGNEEGGNCNHMLLFDLINEVLMEIYERCYHYSPMPLSSLCHIHRMPVGYSVLKDVWFRISWYLRSKPQDGQSLDYLMSRDLWRADGWMNLQFDSECVGLEVEDLIFDGLLDELLMFD